MRGWDWNALGRWPLLLAAVLAFLGAVYIFRSTPDPQDGRIGGFVLVFLGAILLGGFLVVEGHNMHSKDKRCPEDKDIEL